MRSIPSIRSPLYNCLALGFQKPTAELLTRLAEGLAFALSAWRGAGARTSDGTVAQVENVERLARQVLDAGELLELELAYNRLFVGPGRPLSHPYESVYRDGLLMGEPATRVARLYAEAGFVPWPGGKELPDHVAAEFGYMAFLATGEERARRQADGAAVEDYRLRQERFLADHLRGWLSLFCDRVLAVEEHPFYTALARLARDSIQDEIQSAISTGDRSHQAVPRRTRYPNIQVFVDPRLCTLCGICARVCPIQALHLETCDGQVALSFDRADCNGCRGCLRTCPEGAIAIEKRPPLAHPLPSERRTLTSSPRVVCPLCGNPHVAQVWLRRVIERVGRTEDGFVRALQLCPACRAVASNP